MRHECARRRTLLNNGASEYHLEYIDHEQFKLDDDDVFVVVAHLGDEAPFDHGHAEDNNPSADDHAPTRAPHVLIFPGAAHRDPLQHHKGRDRGVLPQKQSR
ncbi:MAG: hypothetical protein M3Y49_15955 [Actinomycetota bacterium]|nr:hypothetical protein [Actinomycetota bacterium]